MSIEPRVTAEMFEQMRFDDCRAELWRGVIVRRPFHDWRNGILVGELGAQLGNWAKSSDAGVVSAAVGWWIEREPDTVLSPPLAFVSSEREKHLGGGFPEVAPDLAVEFLAWNEWSSQGEVPAWLEQKSRKYLEKGTREFWLVRPRERAIHITTAQGERRVLTAEDTLGRGDVLLGFSCSVRDIFSVP